MRPKRSGRLKLLVIGNSHVAALRGGWSKIAARHAETTVDFFAVSKAHIAALELTGDLCYGLFADKRRGAEQARQGLRSLGLPDHVDLKQWDFVLWAGRYWPYRRIADILMMHDVDGIREAGAPSRLSAAAFGQVCDALAEGCLPDPAWRGWSAPRLVYIPAPIKAFKQTDAAPRAGWEAILAQPEGFRSANRVFLDRLERVLLREGIWLLRQPPKTIGDTGVTLDRFARRSPRLLGEGRHSGHDQTHMNEHYGALCLERFLAIVSRDATDSRPFPDETLATTEI